MKTLLILLIVGLTPLMGAIPVKMHDLTLIYGKPTSTSAGSEFSKDDITITAHPYYTTLTSITFTRSSPFNAMEIPDLLAPLSPSEKWKQTGPHEWTLEQAKIKAVWDGAGKIIVQ